MYVYSEHIHSQSVTTQLETRKIFINVKNQLTHMMYQTHNIHIHVHVPEKKSYHLKKGSIYP